MQKRVKQAKQESFKVDFNDRKVGIWGLLALILIVFGFIIAPLMPGLFDRDDLSGLKFGSYRGKPIYYEKDSKFARYVNYYSNLYSGFTKEKNLSVEYSIWSLAFTKHIEDIALLDLAKANGLYVSKDILNKRLLNSPVYLDSSGNFSPKRYKKVSDYQKFKIHNETVENLLSSNMQILLNSNLILADSLTHAIKTMSEVRRNISYVSLSYQDFPQDEIIFYAERNPRLFKSLDITSIRFKNLGDANDAYEKLVNNTPFEELAKFYSEDIANFKGISSSRRYYFDLDLVFEKKDDLGMIFSLGMNEFSRPIKSKNGNEYEIYKVLSNVYGFDKNSEHDISSVKRYIETYEPSIIETFLENKFSDILLEINSDGLGRTLKKHKLTLKEDIVNLAYNMSIYPSTLRELSAFSNSKDFYDVIFDLKESHWSKPFLADRKVYIFSLSSGGNSAVANIDDLIKEDDIIDSLYQANHKLVVDSILRQNDFKDNFNEAFFALQDFSLNAGK
ncbi:hypothetical protein CR532_00190 [Candidatus Borreliella tachyglossi]|uniref:PpiC domain-containing protein n=1 Tax=Candidatus Borreliella tachyglossi TaxID=1964448 RepID=A0A2S1LVX9_9SPIR|nr:peptidylprolyl isomerase [Candidatus Borreliella tachyglossi]AWG42444.1 hypothetical protein CR532_00190 [Candidatus Borreliella tachyglossi]